MMSSFFLPVLDHLVSISAGLVPVPALCPGAGAAERSQKTLYVKKVFFRKIQKKKRNLNQP
jgi:hypothetical protein